MDPNVNLEELRELAEEMLVSGCNPEHTNATRLAELVIALDEWIVKGGFLPKEWQR